MILEGNGPPTDDDFERALATARDGGMLDWPFPEAVMAALAAVADDPTTERTEAARRSWTVEVRDRRATPRHALHE